MLLENVKKGHSLKHKILLRVASFMMGADAPDILRVLMYRPEFFGQPVGKLEQAVLRGDSDWSVGERELFAAFISLKNKCRFCVDAHTGVAARAMGDEIVQAAMADYPNAPITDKARAMLAFLEKLTLNPMAVTPQDVVGLRSAKISDRAIVDAIYICMIFCMFNRIADAFQCGIMTPKQIQASAKFLLERGYG